MPFWQNPNEPDLSGLDTFVFVPQPDTPPITATGVLNTITANEPFLNDFADFLDFNNIEGAIRFDPPSIESTGNGDDIVVRLTAEDLSIMVTIEAVADGSDTTMTITRMGMTPEDFAALNDPVDPTLDSDMTMNDFFGLLGFQPFDPFGGFFGPADRSFNDGNLFGSYDFYNLSGSYGGFGGGGSGGGGGGSFYERYSSYEGFDYINFDIG
ncbi:MAG: hypothetical protein ACRC14_14650 [Paracoccaceae bacterium]